MVRFIWDCYIEKINILYIHVYYYKIMLIFNIFKGKLKKNNLLAYFYLYYPFQYLFNILIFLAYIQLLIRFFPQKDFLNIQLVPNEFN